MNKKREEGLWKRFERDSLYGKAPEGWNHPLLNVISSRINRYGDNEEWKGHVLETTHLYADGGLTGVNARDGTLGTWGVCGLYARHGRMDESFTDKGMCFPQNFGLGMEYVTNNQAELWAVCMALSCMPQGWSGELVLDSEVTADRITNPRRTMTAIRPDDRAAMRILLLDRVDCKVRVIPGHGKDLADRDTYGNVRCDKLANEARKEYERKVQSGEWVDVMERERQRKGVRSAAAVSG